jgi:hypothetical protein
MFHTSPHVWHRQYELASMTLLVVTTSLAPQCGHLAGRAAVFGSGSAVRPANVGLNFDGNGIAPHKREALVRAQPEMAEKLRKAED